jgi:hypothetical protein
LISRSSLGTPGRRSMLLLSMIAPVTTSRSAAANRQQSFLQA